MRGRRQVIILASIMFLLFIGGRAEATYFVFTKKGNIRSDPGTNYRVISQLAKGTIAEIADSFSNYEGKWIAIDAWREFDKNTKAREGGLHQIGAQKPRCGNPGRPRRGGQILRH